MKQYLIEYKENVRGLWFKHEETKTASMLASHIVQAVDKFRTYYIPYCDVTEITGVYGIDKVHYDKREELNKIIGKK